MKKVSKLGFSVALTAVFLLGLSAVLAPPADARFIQLDPPCPALACGSLSGYTHDGFCHITHPSDPDCISDCELWRHSYSGATCYRNCAEV